MSPTTFSCARPSPCGPSADPLETQGLALDRNGDRTIGEGCRPLGNFCGLLSKAPAASINAWQSARSDSSWVGSWIFTPARHEAHLSTIRIAIVHVADAKCSNAAAHTTDHGCHRSGWRLRDKATPLDREHTKASLAHSGQVDD